MTPSRLRQTKIVCTLGPATDSEAMLEKLLRQGADVLRLNMAHADHDWSREVIKRVREVSQRLGREVAIMMDIKGPEIRTGDVAEPLELKAGEHLDFMLSPESYASPPPPKIREVSVNYAELDGDLSVGDTMLVDNGLLRFAVREIVPGERIRCEVLVDGRLNSRRHINLPGVKVSLPAFTEKDRRDTLVGIETGVDFIALSFVREARDIINLRDFLMNNGSKARIIAKIEDQSAISNLDEIIHECDALMVARGDLGIECPLEELPIIQRRAVKACYDLGRAVIIATHMLESMIESPLPTRAEITDIANAVYEAADCVMLSGETSIGKFPLDCMRTLDRVARRIEEEGTPAFAEPTRLAGEKIKVLKSAVVLANQIPSSAIVTFTRRGFTAACLAALRPACAPIFALTNSTTTLRQMRLLRGVHPYYMPLTSNPDDTVANAVRLLQREDMVHPGDKLIVATDLLSHDRIVDSVQLRTVHRTD
jgi:pyruvate kinase